MPGLTDLDPLLPLTLDAGEGERLTAVVPGRGDVRAVLYRAHHDGWSALWHARETWELSPVSAEVGADGMAALLTVLRERLRRQNPGPDSACSITWPSRDLAVAPALLGHGFVPYTVLAVRATPARPPTPEAVHGIHVRRAGSADVGDLVTLWLAELRYSALVGSAVPRADAADLVERELHRAVRAAEPVWVAEADGVLAGLAVCRWPEPAGRRLPSGRWGHVGTVSVAPALRGGGIGRALLSMAHGELLARGARGTFLFYSPHNALSSVFWHRQGYRPLWTTWEVRPAAAS